MSGSEVHILLVEDDEMDVRILQRAFKQHKIANPIHVACDGVKALEMLRGQSGHAPLPQPLLILLDLNMPRMNGISFLQALRQDLKLHVSIVFMLTTSDDDHDKAAAYEKHIAGYLMKSQTGDDFLQVPQLVEQMISAVHFPLE